MRSVVRETSPNVRGVAEVALAEPAATASGAASDPILPDASLDRIDAPRWPKARPAAHPLELTEDEFIPAKEWQKEARRTYFDDDGARLVESSRTTPQRDMGVPLGAWMLDDFVGIRGKEVSQLRLLDPNLLISSEDTEPFKQQDIERYAAWMREGRVAPPITVMETIPTDPDAPTRLKITDGHRRWQAAMRAEVPILAWVAPVVTVEERGEPWRTGLTLENAAAYTPVPVMSPAVATRQKLRDTLLGVAGTSVCFARGLPEDIEKILDRGVLFGKTHKRMPGRPNQCHWNSALCWESNKDKARIATGYALSSDGMWREHTWVAVERRPGASPSNGKAWWNVETTTNRLRYFGYVLTPEECEQFFVDNEQ